MTNKYWNINSLKNKAFLWQYKDIGLFRSLVKLQKNEKILDVGCGFSPLGQAFYPFILPDGSIHGIDIDPELIIAAKDYVESIGRQKNFQFSTGDAHNLSQIFLNDTFDLVMCQQLLINVVDPLGVILEMKKVCNKNHGRVFAVENCNLGAFVVSLTLNPRDLLRLSQVYQKIVILGQNMVEGSDTTRGLYIAQYFQNIGLNNIQSVYIIPTVPIVDPHITAKQQNNLEEQVQENRYLIDVFSRWVEPLVPDIVSAEDWTFFKDNLFKINMTRENSEHNHLIQVIHPLIATVGWINPQTPEENETIFPIDI